MSRSQQRQCETDISLIDTRTGCSKSPLRTEASSCKRFRRERYGLITHWMKKLKPVRNTYNARAETVALKSAFRSAWHKAQHRTIAAEDSYEPDYCVRLGWRTYTCSPT